MTVLVHRQTLESHHRVVAANKPSSETVFATYFHMILGTHPRSSKVRRSWLNELLLRHQHDGTRRFNENQTTRPHQLDKPSLHRQIELNHTPCFSPVSLYAPQALGSFLPSESYRLEARLQMLKGHVLADGCRYPDSEMTIASGASSRISRSQLFGTVQISRKVT